MFTADVRFEGWTTEDWRRFLHLWKPRAARAEEEANRPRGGVIVVHDGVRVRKLLHTKKGRLPPPKPDAPMPGDEAPLAPSPPTLARIAEAEGASWGLSAHFGSLDEVMERFGARARRGDDLTTQALLLAGIVREMIDEGAIETWPRRLRGIPLPTTPMVQRTLDSVCADEHAIALALFKDGALYTSFVARRRGYAFDVVAGPGHLRTQMGLLSGDFRRDYRHFVRAVEAEYAPLSFGCFAEADAFRALQLDARPGAWGRAVAVRDVVLSPIPTAVGLALGADGARLAWDKMRVVRRRVDPHGLLDPFVDGLRHRVAQAAGDRAVTGTLGFDPMAALRALLRR